MYTPTASTFLGNFGTRIFIISVERFSTVASPSNNYVVSFGTCNSNIPFGPLNEIK